MKVYTYSEAHQRLSDVLDEAKSRGESRIKRRDGSEFVIRPAPSVGSPLDVEGVETHVSLRDVLDAIREGRERGASVEETGKPEPLKTD